jgi:hypothetical protein
MPFQQSSQKRKILILSVLFGTVTLLSVLVLVYAVIQKTEADRMAQIARSNEVVAKRQKLEAENQKKHAMEQEEILKLRILELEYKYEMCMTKK